MQKYILFFVLCFIASSSLSAQLQGEQLPPFLPQPQKTTWNYDEAFELLDGEILEDLLSIKTVDNIPEATINQEEAYRLTVLSDSILLEATTPTGIYRARQTLSQLVQYYKNKAAIPTCEIVDWPAFRLRGYMHDVGRSFISVDELKKHIRLLAKFKINTFRWHLTENEGWRLESKVFPELNDSINFERLHRQYYTIEDAKEIAEYCKQHEMLLIPEIDMPGHSAAFVRAMKTDMQSEKGMTILKRLLDEICEEVFPDVPYLHIGTDEVQFTNPTFVPEMVNYIRAKGKKVISWNPGWKYKVGEIDMTQLWSYRGKPQPGIPAIDSRFHYINHFDAFADIIALYNSKILNIDEGNDDIAGGIVAIWNDRLLEDEKQIILQNNFYPSMLAFAERSWIGGGSEYYDDLGTMLPTDTSSKTFKEFQDFEDRMMWHKSSTFADEPFAYVKQTNVKWNITDAFPNQGDLTKTFPPEEKLSPNGCYEYEGNIYNTFPAIGASFYLRHVWGPIVPGFYDEPKENHTAYAHTWVWSPKKQEVGLWASTQDYSRSEKDIAPKQGKWDYRESKVFINDNAIAPPVWENSHTTLTNEIPLKNENFSARPPLLVTLNKGWNKVFLKLPIGKFSSPEIRLQKWMFTFVFVTPDGKEAMPELIYDPNRNL
ncbi:MAG: family 20 glycosylhydrolase [Bacteroidales bacterium]|nr:family 20 glycosylhydrolase [Bacteroidales bacterium]